MRSFALFLTAFLGLYALVHAYAYATIHRFFPLRGGRRIAVLAAFAFLLAFPVMGHVLDARGMERLGPVVLLAGYEWMVLLFLFVSASLAADGIRLILFLAGRTRGRRGVSGRAGRYLFLGAAAAALGAFGYGHLEARHLRVHRLELTSPKVPRGENPVRIVQVSDLHLGAVNSTRAAERVAGLVESLKPDMLVATGDMVDRGMPDPEAVAGVLRSIQAPLGKFAVTGNHEFYRDVEASVRFLERSGFRVLRGEEARPAPWLSVMGVDDEAAHRFGGPRGSSLETLLDRVGEERWVLVLHHRPVVGDASRGRFDLQLSGHTHGGQVFPFNLVVALAYPFVEGSYRLGEGSLLHVNRGTGTWGPPVRLGSPPEITVIELRSRRDAPGA
jgi:hypothetical protein